MTEPHFVHPLEEVAETWPEELDHISASSVKMAVRCPEQWRQRYIKGRRLPPAANLLLGRADHSAIEFSMIQKVTSHVDLPIQDVQEKFLADLDTEIDKEGGLSELEITGKDKKPLTTIGAKKKELGVLKKDGHALVGQYHKLVSPVLQPLMVEQPIVLKPKRLPVKVEGYIDLIVEDGVTGSRIIDRKRANSLRTQPEWNIQAEVYQMAYPVPHDWHLSVTTKGGYIALPGDAERLTQAPPPSWKCELTLTHICAEIGHYYSRYGPDEPWPAKGRLHPWACNYCGFREGCWGWQET